MKIFFVFASPSYVLRLQTTTFALLSCQWCRPLYGNCLTVTFTD